MRAHVLDARRPLVAIVRILPQHDAVEHERPPRHQVLEAEQAQIDVRAEIVEVALAEREREVAK